VCFFLKNETLCFFANVQKNLRVFPQTTKMRIFFLKIKNQYVFVENHKILRIFSKIYQIFAFSPKNYQMLQTFPQRKPIFAFFPKNTKFCKKMLGNLPKNNEIL
jgi:hypothetical protein